MLAKVISENQKDWSEWINYVTFCYNATTHSATGFAPFFVFTGRAPLWNIDFLLPEIKQGQKRLPEYTAEVVERLERASNMVRDHLHAAAESASKWYTHEARPRSFEPADEVRVYYPRRVTGRSPKWQSFFKTEGVVVKKLNDVSYVVGSKSWKADKIIQMIMIMKRISQFCSA